MEFNFNGLKSYICTLDDYEDIKRIHLSRKTVHGAEKTVEFNSRFPTITRGLLRGVKPDQYLLGCRNLDTGELVSYCITHIPKDHPFGFIRFAESMARPGVFLENGNGVGWLFKLTSMLSEADNKMDFFFAVKYKSYYAGQRLLQSNARTPENDGIFDRYTPLLHSVVRAGDVAKNPVEKHLLPEPAPIIRIKDIAIVQFALKNEFRINHWKNLLANS